MTDETPVRFHVTSERVEEMEFGLLMDVSSESMSNKAAGEFLAFFAVDENGHYLDTAAAMASVRRLKVSQLMTTVEQLIAQIQEASVPNE